MKDLEKIGSVEQLDFPELHISGVHSRVDTGARTSSLWVSSAVEVDDGLEVIFFGPGSPHYSGKKYTFHSYEKTVVASSTGHVQERYKVQVLVNVKGKKIRGRFTLADRASQVYPVLVGRNILRGKFIVDVKLGRPLTKLERLRSSGLRSRLSQKEQL